MIFLGFVLSGCVGTGSEKIKDVSEAQINSQIKAGVTTADQVKAMFGSPLSTSFTDGGLAIWTYQYDDVSALTAETVGSMVFTLGLAGTKAEGTRNELVVLFDENDVVKRFNMSNSPISQGTGAFR